MKNYLRRQNHADFERRSSLDAQNRFAKTASYPWRDGGWLSYRAKAFDKDAAADQPINIYEFHPDTCLVNESGDPLPSEDYAREISSYVKQMGYTHVAISLVWEHTKDSDGTPSFCFAPAARYGSPSDWMGFADSMHEAGIGVLLHWSPKAFDLSLPAVQSFLLSNAVRWIEEYHVDGLLIDSKPPRPEAAAASVAFLQRLTAHLRASHPDALTVLTDAVDGVDASFTYHSTFASEALAYLQTDPLWRKYEHGRLTSCCTAPLPNTLLPLSCDLIRGQGFLDRMAGDYTAKFANARLLLALMMTVPGKKLLFSGYEFGQFRGWSEERPVEWFLTDFEAHAALQEYTAALNHLYLQSAPLWELDGSPCGFAWIDADNREESILSYRRIDKRGEELIVVLNFTPIAREDVITAVSRAGDYEIVFSSDCEHFGGSGRQSAGVYVSEPIPSFADQHAIHLSLPPLTALVLRRK